MLFCEQKAKFPYPSLILGRVLGPSEDIGNEMSQWILIVDGRILSRQTVRPLTNKELWSPLELARRKAFDAAIKRKLGGSITITKSQEPEEYLPYEDEEDGNEIQEMPDSDEGQYDLLINFEVNLPHMDKQMKAVVVGRHMDEDGNLVGRSDENAILSMAVYDVAFPDGAVKQYAANIIADNMYAQVNEDRHSYLMLDAITGHRKNDDTVKASDQYMILKNGRRKLCQTTRG